jgi:hypothetical protein
MACSSASPPVLCAGVVVGAASAGALAAGDAAGSLGRVASVAGVMVADDGASVLRMHAAVASSHTATSNTLRVEIVFMLVSFSREPSLRPPVVAGIAM